MPLAEPLKVEEAARPADGSIVMVLATEEAASRMKGHPVYISGIGWAQDTPNLEERDWTRASYTVAAARQAYRMAGLQNPSQRDRFRRG